MIASAFQNGIFSLRDDGLELQAYLGHTTAYFVVQVAEVVGAAFHYALSALGSWLARLTSCPALVTESNHFDLLVKTDLNNHLSGKKPIRFLTSMQIASSAVQKYVPTLGQLEHS